MNNKLRLLSAALFSVALISSIPVAAHDYDNQSGTDRNTSNAAPNDPDAQENRANIIESGTSGAMQEAREKRLESIESDVHDEPSTRPATNGGVY